MYILYNHCAYPRNVTWTYLVYIISLLFLFLRFYFKMTAKLAAQKKADKAAAAKSK